MRHFIIWYHSYSGATGYPACRIIRPDLVVPASGRSGMPDLKKCRILAPDLITLTTEQNYKNKY